MTEGATVALPAGVRVTVVPWDDPRLVAMRAEQQDELAGMYGRGDFVELGVPAGEQMVATVALDVDGDVVACGSLRDAAEHGDGYGEIKRMYVRPRARGRGLARHVLDRLHEVAAQAGLRRIILETGDLQVPAVRLYRSAGYRRIRAYGPYVDDPASVCYARWLVPDVGARVLVVNGTVGAGKTTVAEAVADLLRERGVPYAWIDVDALRRAYPTATDDPFGQAVALDHLEAMAGVLRRRGYRHVVLAEVVERRADRELYEQAFDGAELAVVRLTASERTRLARIDARERDPWREWHLARTVELAAILETAGVDDAVVDNDAVDNDAADNDAADDDAADDDGTDDGGDQPLREVAAEVLAAAGWE